MSKYSIKQFIQQTKQQESARDFFELETDRLLEVNLNAFFSTFPHKRKKRFIKHE